MRSNPYPPIFKSKAANRTDTDVGASTCASGNHVWKGTIGSLIPKPINNNRKAQYLASSEPIFQGLFGSSMEFGIKLEGSVMPIRSKLCTTTSADELLLLTYNPIITMRMS